MRKHTYCLLCILLLSCILIGCSSYDNESPKNPIANVTDNTDTTESVTVLDPIMLDDPVTDDPDTEIGPPRPPAKEPTIDDFDISSIPDFDGSTPIITINNDMPYFNDDFINGVEGMCLELYTPRDPLGRCGEAIACVCKDTLPTEDRGEIGSVKPSGWHTVKYNDIIEGNYLYNRCHLIAYCLTGENANEDNLITGTRYLNIDGMLPYETLIADYMDKNPDNHVLYRVTPIYASDTELVVRGVLMEGYSIEDHGEGICFCVYAYNNQPGISIDYATGDSEYTGEYLDTARANHAASVKNAESDEAYIDTDPVVAPSETSSESNNYDYVLNSNSHKFHYPDCTSVDKITDNNRIDFNGTRQEVMDMGYEPCKICNP